MIKYKVRVDSDGDESWYLNGKRHRENGPAIIWYNGHKEWCIDGKLHREDGPAIECTDGRVYWYLNGKQVTEEEVMNPKKTITIDGKTIEISNESFQALKEQLND